MRDARDGVLDGSSNCPVVPIVNNRPDPAALARVFADDNCFSYQEMFPGGFTPQFGGDVKDYSAVVGIRGQTEKRLSWGASAGYGSNEVQFFIDNTVNASLGPDSPTSFDPGLYRQEEVNLNLKVGYPISSSVHLAGGLEWRDEKFTIGVGQTESWVNGPFADQGFSAASNGFPGFSPISEGNWSRSNFAGYVDMEAGKGSNWTLGVAARLEHFADFGTTLNGKLAGRYEFNPNVAARASLSTGFRAPTPGQSNAYNVSTQFDLVLMDLVNNGTIPSISEVAALRGGEPLEAEKSRNYSAGFILRGGKVSVTDRLLPRRPARPPGRDPELRPDAGGGGGIAGGRHHQRGQHRELPLLHQRLRDHDPGHRRGGHVHHRQHRRAPAVQLHRHRGHGLQPRHAVRGPHPAARGGPAHDARRPGRSPIRSASSG